MALRLEVTVTRKHRLRPTGLIQQTVRAAQKEFGEAVVDAMREYPPETPGQQYVRTFNLRDRWDSIPDGDDVIIYNRTKYARRVQGSGGQQSEFFAGRGWQRFDETFREIHRKFGPDFARAVRVVF